MLLEISMRNVRVVEVVHTIPYLPVVSYRRSVTAVCDFITEFI